jgi:TRAP-type C4-dicarboxylate transport system permease small subunit
MLWTAVAAIARVAVWFGGAMIFAAAAIVTAEVVLRKGLGTLIGTAFVFSGSDEISSFLFAVGTSWSMAHVLVTRGHVRIDALYGYFAPRTRVLLDLFALLVLGIFAAALLERVWDVASTSYIEEIRSNSPQRLPLAWAQVPWFAGIALFFLALVLAFLRSAAALLRGDYAAAAAIAGAASQDEEIESELQGLGIQREEAGAGDR